MSYNALQYTTLFIDNFHRPDEQPLDPTKWTVSTVPGDDDDLAVVNNVCVSVAPAFDGVEAVTGIAVPADQFLVVTIGQFLYNGGSAINLFARSTLDVQTAYYAALFNKQVELSVFVAGVETSLGTVALAAINPGDILRLEAFGSLISVLYNDVVLISVTDTTIASGLPVLEVAADTVASDTTARMFATGSIVRPTNVVPILEPALITPGWPLAAAPAANPIASGPNFPAQTPDPSDAGQVARQTRALAQASETNSRLE